MKNFNLVKTLIVIVSFLNVLFTEAQTLTISNNSNLITEVPLAGQQNIPLFGFTLVSASNITFQNIYVSYSPNNLNENFVGGSYRLVTCTTSTFNPSNFTVRSNSANPNAVLEFNMNNNQYASNTTYYFFVIANARSSYNSGFPKLFTFGLNSDGNPRPFRSNNNNVSTNNFGVINHSPAVVSSIFQWKGSQNTNFHNSQNWVDSNGNNTNAAPNANSTVYIGTVSPTSNRWPIISNNVSVAQMEISAQNGNPSLTVNNNTLSISGNLVIRNLPSSNATYTINGSGTINVGKDLKAGNFVAPSNNPNSPRTTTINSSINSLLVGRDFNISSAYAHNNRFNNVTFNLVSGDLSVGNQLNLSNIDVDNAVTFDAQNVNSKLSLGGSNPILVSNIGSKTLNLPKTVDYNGTQGQAIYPVNYTNLTISGNKNFGNITLPNGTINISGSLINTSTNANYVTTGSTINYNGVDQNIARMTYGNLVFSNSGIKSLDNNIEVNGSLTLTNNTEATVDDAQTITVHGALIVGNDANFTIKNNGNLIQSGSNNTNTGVIRVEVDSAPVKRLDISLWSSPVESQNLFDFSNETLPNRFFSYTETNNSWGVVPNVQNYNMSVGKGYGVRSPDNWNPTTPTIWNGVFEGKPNSGDVTIQLSNISAGRFNLIGNPYPSSINLQTLYDENNTKIDNKFYVYEHTNFPASSNESIVNYGILTLNPKLYVPATNSERIGSESVFENNPNIRIGQGFFIKAVENENGSGILNISNNTRNNNIDNSFFRTQNSNSISSEYDMFRVKITSPSNTQNQMIVGFFEGSTNEIDPIDTSALGNPTIYSLVDNRKLIINGNAFPFENSTMISVGFKADLSGNYSLSTYDFRGVFENNPIIILHDLQLNQYHNLSLSDYQFNSEIGVFENRFKIIFSSILSNPEINANENELLIFQNESDVQISLGQVNSEKIESVILYDVLGRFVNKSENVNQTNFSLSKSKLQNNAMYVIEVKNDSGQRYTSKIIVR